MTLVQSELKKLYIGSTPIKKVTIRPNGTEKQIRPPYRTLTCYIDESKSDPAQMVTYGSDVPFTAGSSDRDDFFGYYPCLLNTSGVETAKLDPNNYAQDINGNSVNITNGDNVMVCFPRLGLKMSKSGSIVTMQLTDNPNDPSFDYYAHQRGNTNKDKFYYGAYKAYKTSGDVLKSWSGYTPTRYVGWNNGRTYAQANGSGYEMAAFYQKTFIQALYVFKYKNLDSQGTIGKGYTTGSANLGTTGTLNTQGLTYGNTSSNTTRVKLFGIEELRGGSFEWLEGYYGTGGIVYLANDNFNSTQSNYITSYTKLGNNGGETESIRGTSLLGFLASSTVSNNNWDTYYCDFFMEHDNTLIPFVGGYTYGEAGIFQFFANNASNSGGYNDIVARIMYL